MNENEQAIIQAFIDSFDWGVTVIQNRQSQVLMNDAFVDMFNVPNEVQFNMSYEGQMSYVSSLMKDDDAFIEEIHNAETQPTLNTRDLFHSIDGRSLETTSKPITIDGNVLGRIWHFRELSSKDIQSDTTLVIKKRQELLANIISQTIQKRSPKEILTKTLHNLGQVFAVERAFIYQLSRKIPEGISCHWMADSHILNDAEYYNYFQKNPWVWHFYTQPQCNHIEQGENDPAMRINSLLEEMQVVVIKK